MKFYNMLLKLKISRLYPLYIFLGILLYIGCKKDITSLKEEVNLYPIKEINAYSDSSYYFGHIINSTVYNDIIIFNDSKLNKAIQFDTSLQFKKIIGGAGKGPNEFGKLQGNPIVDDNNIYLYDLTKNKIKCFKKNGEYYRAFDYPIKKGVDFILQFDYCKDTNNYFYSSSYITNKPIFKFNQQGQILDEFGEFLPSLNTKHKRALNYRHNIMTQGNEIISVYTRKPRIEIFSNKGGLLTQYNYNHFFDYYNERVKKRIKEDPNNKYRRPTLFRDTYYNKNRLYLLYWGHKIGQHPYANQVAVFLKDGINLHFEKIIKLKTNTGQGSFSTICVFNNNLIAFEVLSGNLLMYKL